MPVLVILVSSEVYWPDCLVLQVKPAYLASALWESKALIEPISAKIPLASTGPIPGIEIRDSYSVVLRPLIVFSIALSTAFISFSKALITLKDDAIATFKGSYSTLSRR